MQTSLKMLLGLVSLVTITLLYWGTIQQKSTWGSDAMTTTKLAAKSAAANLPKRIFCYGDSLTAGTSPPGYENYPYAVYLEQALRERYNTEITVGWRGFPGWTSSLLLTDGGLGDALTQPMDLVIILAGTNDLAYASSPDSIVESIQGLHQLALENNCRHTLALGIPPSAWQARSESAKNLATAVNQQLQESSLEFRPFPIETYDPSSGLWSSDGLHFSKKGYEYLGTALAPIVAELLSME